MTDTLTTRLRERDVNAAADILAAILTVPRAERLSALAVATRAALDAGIFEGYKRAGVTEEDNR